MGTRIERVASSLGVDSPFFSPIVLFNKLPFSSDFRRFSRKKDPWKESMGRAVSLFSEGLNKENKGDLNPTPFLPLFGVSSTHMVNSMIESWNGVRQYDFLCLSDRVSRLIHDLNMADPLLRFWLAVRKGKQQILGTAIV